MTVNNENKLLCYESYLFKMEVKMENVNGSNTMNC